MSSTPPDSPAVEGAGRGRPHVPVLVVVTALALQALAMAFLAVDGLVHLGAGRLPLGAGVFLVVLYMLLAAWIGAVAWGMLRGRGFSRGAAVAVQLFGVILSSWLLSLGAAGLGVGLLVVSGAALVCLFSRPVAHHLGRGADVDR